MQLNELKESMSVLDQVLSKTSTDIKINVSASQTAKSHLLTKYRRSSISTAILAIVFTLLWIGNVNLPALQVHIHIFLIIYLALASVWYILMYFKLKKLSISRLTPAKLFAKTATLKIYTLSGEIIFGIGIIQFFMLFLPDLYVINVFAFWLCIGTIIVSLVLSVWYLWPKYIKLFRDLNTIKE